MQQVIVAYCASPGIPESNEKSWNSLINLTASNLSPKTDPDLQQCRASNQQSTAQQRVPNSHWCLKRQGVKPCYTRCDIFECLTWITCSSVTLAHAGDSVPLWAQHLRFAMANHAAPAAQSCLLAPLSLVQAQLGIAQTLSCNKSHTIAHTVSGSDGAAAMRCLPTQHLLQQVGPNLGLV